MNFIFWSVVAIDAVLFTGIVVSLGLQGGANSSGGREMGIAFFGVLPLLILGIAVLLFVYSQATFWKVLALIIIAGPGLFLAGSQIRNLYIDYQIGQNARGRSYFEGKAGKAMGEAVVNGDLVAIERLAREVDVNAVGKRQVTLISLAAERMSEADTPERANQQLEVIRTLLKLGARPDPALATAVKVKDPAVLQALLEAGAKPNQGASEDRPLVFDWLAVMPLENLRLLIAHGLDVNAQERGIPLAFAMANHQRWDLLLLAAQHGADLAVQREDGRSGGSEVMRRIEEARASGQEPAPELSRLQALTDADPPAAKR